LLDLLVESTLGAVGGARYTGEPYRMWLEKVPPESWRNLNGVNEPVDAVGFYPMDGLSQSSDSDRGTRSTQFRLHFYEANNSQIITAICNGLA
jgi:hypothetical protein